MQALRLPPGLENQRGNAQIEAAVPVPVFGGAPFDPGKKEFFAGQYYDVLNCNAYALQFINGEEPFSAKQEENIRAHFKGNKFEKVLLRKNEEVKRWAAVKGETVVNETPDVPAEKLMDAIVAKHKGSVVVVDFWATWCGPCLQAMEDMKPMKPQWKKEGVVFVYLSSTSSPEKLWREKAGGIGSEHYYITDGNQWETIMDGFGFEYIPSYLIFDREGRLKEKITAYPGNEEMRKKIVGTLG